MDLKIFQNNSSFGSKEYHDSGMFIKRHLDERNVSADLNQQLCATSEEKWNAKWRQTHSEMETHLLQSYFQIEVVTVNQFRSKAPV